MAGVQVGLGDAVLVGVLAGRVEGSVSVCVFEVGVGGDGKRNRFTGTFVAGRPSVVSRTWQVMGGRVECTIVWS